MHGWFRIALLVLLLIVGGALLLTNHLAPPATGKPSHALPLQPAQTQIDRELAPLLAAHPGKTGAIFLSDGLDAFAARAISARKAGRSLDLQYFIWHDDLAGRLVASEVHDAAERGVRVRILLDDMNATGLDPHLLAMDAHPNIELRLYNPFRNRESAGRVFELLRRRVSMNHRMHNKAWIADGRVAIIGGRNISEQYFSADAQVNFRDLDLLLFGPAVQQASRDLRCLLEQRRRGADRDAWARGIRRRCARCLPTSSATRVAKTLGGTWIAWPIRNCGGTTTGPRCTRAGAQASRSSPIHRSSGRGDNRAEWLVGQLTPMISAARREALVISPYFVPGEDGTERLTALTRRGVARGRRHQLAGRHRCLRRAQRLRGVPRPPVATGRGPSRTSREPACAERHRSSSARAPACTPRPSCWMARAGSSGRSTSTRARRTSTPRWAWCSRIRSWPRNCATSICAWSIRR